MEIQGQGNRGHEEKQKPARVDRKIIGLVQMIVDGPTGKDGIQAKAIRVRTLDEAIERAEKTIAELEDEIARMNDGLLGELVGPMKALFEGKLGKMNRAREGLETLRRERRQKSEEVMKGIASIESFVDSYANDQEEHRSGERVAMLLRNMGIHLSLCANSMASLQTAKAQGKSIEVKTVDQIFQQNKNIFEKELHEYHEEVKRHPRWAGNLELAPSFADKNSIVRAREDIQENLSALTVKMNEYMLEIKQALPNNIGVNYLTEDKKSYFRDHATQELFPHDNTEISENNS